jgi:hypothetical protein
VRLRHVFPVGIVTDDIFPPRLILLVNSNRKYFGEMRVELFSWLHMSDEESMKANEFHVLNQIVIKVIQENCIFNPFLCV